MADNFQYVQSIKHTLAGSGVTATVTTIVLKSFQLPDGSTNITLSNFGTIGFGTLEPGTTREEVISFTGVTQNSDGTADLTGVTRGLRFVSPYTTLAANRKAHSGGSIFVISNNPQHYDKLAGKDNDETILQTWTYEKFPVKSGGLTPTSADELATKSYVDSVVGGSANFDQNLVAGNAGVTLVAGDWVFLDEADQEWKKTDASASATSEGVIVGVAQGAGVDAGAIANGVLIGGLEKGQSGLTPGAKQFLSDTPGTISGSAGTVEVFVGIANSATEVILAHNHTQETLTADEKDAASGTSGTPSSSNKFITEADGTFTETKAFFDATDITGAEAETLTDTSNADALHNHTGVVDVQTFTSDGTWTKPSSGSRIHVQLRGAGASGGRGSSTNEGGGGGGGAYAEVWFDIGDLGSTESIQVGVGGTAITGDNTSGNVGEDTTFGTLATAFGGGAGFGNAGGSAGGGGGGTTSVGLIAVAGTGGAGGGHRGGAGGTSNNPGAVSDFGGGGGGGANGFVGGASFYGGGGGASGETVGGAGAAGGSSEFGSGGGGGANESGSGGAGGVSRYSGNGGAGAIDTNAATAGTVPGGGGGGSQNANSGAGADGQVIVTTF